MKTIQQVLNLTSTSGCPMARTLYGSVLVCLMISLNASRAQTPVPMLLPGGAPLVYTTFVGPANMQVGIFHGNAAGRFYPTTSVFGMRPGYLHRVELLNPPGHPGLALFPTLEIRGTLYLPQKLRASSYPAAISFTAEEIDRVLAGAFITKVIYLEDPEKAFPVATTIDRPVEIEAFRGEDPLVAAQDRGRPMIIVRLGSRQLEAAEMAQQTQPGLVLTPDQTKLERPPIAPYIAVLSWALIDPIAGPRPPVEECLKDGGDRGLAVGFDNEGHLHGLDPSDTVAEYKDVAGRKQLAISNQVCLCVPRFGVVRAVTVPAGYQNLESLDARNTALAQQNVVIKSPSLMTEQSLPPLAIGKRERPSVAIATEFTNPLIRVDVLVARHQFTESEIAFLATPLHELTAEQKLEFRKQVEVAYQLSTRRSVAAVEGVEGPAVVGRVNELKTITTLQEVRDFMACCNDKIEVPAKPLQLCKWAAQKEYHIGDIVTFHLKYSNLGGKPITDVAVSDSLTARLEYVPGSAKSDRDAVFTLQQNEAGSAIVRWEVRGVLQPGQSGLVTFQAKIR
jgi:uncharacterized repeat protein (TIGR01451 family)